MSETITYVEINAFALIILGLIYLNIDHLREKFLLRQKLFLALIGSTAFELVLDTAVWILDGVPGMAARTAVLSFTVVYCAVSTLPFLLWCVYLIYLFRGESQVEKRLVAVLAVPALINGVLSLVNVFYGIYFYFDSDNVYHRGKLFALVFVFWAFYFAFAAIFLVRTRSRIERHHRYPLFAFLILPIAAGLLQYHFYGLSIIWGSVAISLQVVFMSIQNGHIYTDYLTGLYNRRQLDTYLDDLSRQRREHEMIAGIMLDLDGFKEINDRLGHVMGDAALVDASRILKSCFRKTDLICRYGGDEFVVIIERISEEEILEAVERLRNAAGKFNEKENAPYEIRFSIGHALFCAEDGATARQFLEKLDTYMYLEKKRVRPEAAAT